MKSSASIVMALFLTTALAGLGNNAQAGEEKQEGHHSKHHQKDKIACYQWSAFPNERLNLNIQYHSDLTDKECRRHDETEQVAFSVHGKHIGMCGNDSMAATTGTVVTSYGSSHDGCKGPVTGAHLSLYTGSVRGKHHHKDGNDRDKDTCRPVTFDCTSSEQKRDPHKWYCFSRNEFNEFHGFSILEKVDENHDPRCNVFEDGRGDVLQILEGTGSGLEGSHLVSNPEPSIEPMPSPGSDNNPQK